MKKPRTLKSFLKIVQMLSEMPVSNLKGYQKLTDKEESAIGFLVAGMANDFNEGIMESIKEKIGL